MIVEKAQQYCECLSVGGNVMLGPLADLKRHGPFVAFYFYCKIMLYDINYTYYSVKTVKICFQVPFRG